MNKSECVYIYNDNFLSLLALIIILIRQKTIPKNIKTDTYTCNLFENECILNLPETSASVDYIIKNIGYNNFRVIFKVFLSTIEDKELNIFYYVLYSLKFKEKTMHMKNNKYILNCIKTQEYVSRENHKFKGFTRFKKHENDIYYAEINPTNNILFLLSNHFKKRLSTEFWIIKDVNRGLYSIYNKENFIIASENEFKMNEFKLSDDEKTFEELWIEFYNIIGIKERKNDRCRMNFMPKKYWKYITEMSDEYEKSN